MIIIADDQWSLTTDDLRWPQGTMNKWWQHRVGDSGWLQMQITIITEYILDDHRCRRDGSKGPFKAFMDDLKSLKELKLSTINRKDDNSCPNGWPKWLIIRTENRWTKAFECSLLTSGLSRICLKSNDEYNSSQKFEMLPIICRGGGIIRRRSTANF